jgi:hypothetical protein
MIVRSLLFFFLISSGKSQEVCRGFGTGAVGNEYILQHFSPAVLRVQDVGTAYLIDSERGYLLTAGHVLDDLAAKNETLEVVLGQAPYTHLAFTVAKRSPKLDIALLKLTEANALKAVRALDVSFVPPDYDASLFVMGYPQYGDQRQIFLRSGPAKVHGYPPGGLVEVAHTTAGGSSGGPLLDAFGDVIATAEEQIADNQVGRYLPTVAFEDILDQIPVSPRMQDVGKQLAAGTMGEDALKQLLNKATPDSPSNLELYVWTQTLSKASILAVSKYVRCPLMPALLERHIPDAILPFMASLQPDQVGEAKLALAQNEYTRGHNDAAAELTRESLASLSQGSPSSSSASPLRETALLLGWAIEQQRKLGAGQPVRQDSVAVLATLDSGEIDKYLVNWIGTVDATRSEDGHPSEPLRGWLTDTRHCHWNITSEVQRNVYYVDPKGQVSTDDAVSKISSVGFGNSGSDFVITQLRPENCGDAAAKYTLDVGSAQSALANKFPEIVVNDRNRLVEEFSKLPHVVKVTISSAVQSNH